MDVGVLSLQSRKEAFGLALLLEQMMRLVYPERSPQDMHPGQWAALRFFARANREARTVAGLARYLGITQGPASRSVAALDRKGLITGERDADDRRILRLRLTEAGTDLLAHDPMQKLAGLIASKPEGERAQLSRHIEQLFHAMANEMPSDDPLAAFRTDGRAE
jgi:DNA-binding MarR family transcriptional regulator